MGNESIGGSSKPGPELEGHDRDSIFKDVEMYSDVELNRIICEIKTALLDPEFDKDRLRELWTEYALQTEKRVEQFLDPIEYAKAQISAILYKALLFRDAGNMSRYLEELYAAEDYAYNAGIDDIYQRISEQIILVTDHVVSD